MVSNKAFQGFLPKTNKQLDAVLAALAIFSEPASVSELKAALVSNGLRSAKRWNINTVLSRASHYALGLPEGWVLTDDGEDYLSSLGFKGDRRTTKNAQKSLRDLVRQVSDENWSSPGYVDGYGLVDSSPSAAVLS